MMNIHMETFELTDKQLHCLARQIQGYRIENVDPCLYCKYGLECSDNNENIKQMEAVEKFIQDKTGVWIIPHAKNAENELPLKASWIEDYPELLEKVKDLSLLERRDILTDPDIPLR